MSTRKSQLWTEKYRPNKFTDLIFHNDTHLNALKWLKSYSSSSPFLLLAGPPGIGKTSLAHIIARMQKYHLIEFNASSERNTSLLDKIISTSATRALNNLQPLILVDEIDNIQSDQKFIKALITNKSKIKCPVILTCNNIYTSSIYGNKKHLEIIKFYPVTPDALISTMQRICSNEKLRIELKALNKICEDSCCDIRSTINNLQVLSSKNACITFKMIDKTCNKFYNNSYALAADIFKRTLRTRDNIFYFKYLQDLYDNHKKVLFNICFSSYLQAEKSAIILKRISDTNYLHDKLPEQYGFMFIDRYNSYCRARNKIDLGIQNVQASNQNNVFLFGLCHETNVMEIYPHIANIIKYNMSGQLTIEKIQLFKEIFKNYGAQEEHIFSLEDDTFMTEYYKFKNAVENYSQQTPIVSERCTRFKFSYNEGFSDAIRMEVDIDDLFE